MATSFVEEATLKLNSKATETRIKSVNRLLKDLDRTAKSLSRTLKSMPDLAKLLNFRTTGANNALNDLRRLRTEVQNLRRSTANPLRVQINSQQQGSLSRIPTVLKQSKTEAQRLNTELRGTGRELDSLRGKATYFQRTMARALRVPGYALGGEMYAAGRAATRTAASAPIRLDDAYGRLALAGFDEDEQQRIRGIAERLSGQYRGVNIAELMVASTEAAGSTKDWDIVEKNMEIVAKASVVLGTAMSDAAAGGEAAQQAWKVIQQRGFASSPEEAEALMETVLKAYIASGFQLNPADIVRQMQQSGGLRSGLSNQALFEIALVRDEGGRMSTGEFRMAYDELIRGSLNDKDMAAQIAAGFRDASGKSLVGAAYAASPMQFTRDYIIPQLVKRGVDLNDAAEVQSVIDLELGFTTGATRALTGMVTQMDERTVELERGNKANINAPIDNPTVRARAFEVQQQFSNVSMQALESMLPVMNKGLDILGGALSNISQGNAGATDWATLALGAAPVGITAGMTAILDEETRPLGAAGLALSASAMQLSGAATALTGAAAAQGGASLVGGAARGAGWAAAARGAVGRLGVFGLTALAAWEASPWSGGDEDAQRLHERWRAEGNATVFDRIGDWVSGAVDRISESVDDGARTWERTGDMVTANLADTMVMSAPGWGEAMGESFQNSVGLAGDALAEKIRAALTTPVQVASGIAAAVAGLDTGSMAAGD